MNQISCFCSSCSFSSYSLFFYTQSICFDVQGVWKNYIDLPNMIGSFSGGGTASLVAKNGIWKDLSHLKAIWRQQLTIGLFSLYSQLDFKIQQNNSSLFDQNKLHRGDFCIFCSSYSFSEGITEIISLLTLTGGQRLLRGQRALNPL